MTTKAIQGKQTELTAKAREADQAEKARQQTENSIVAFSCCLVTYLVDRLLIALPLSGCPEYPMHAPNEHSCSTGPIHHLSSLRPTDALSFNVSSVIDRWPVVVLTTLFTRLFGRATVLCVVNGCLWCKVFYAHRPLLRKVKYVNFATCQPLGFYVSWALFILSHHYMVWLAAWFVYPRRKQPFREYALLGDDIVITDRAVAVKYKALLDILDVSISESKSIDSKTGALEFLAEKYGLSRSCLIRLAGAGF
ncbi:hypothetical protein ZIOFF_035052 [Zingiber officinale]|uniref:Uncharacterized protein n=1 Tax=Zingiber officinale TaxID=94328 RepID=A0A8J5L0B7_ZINOF|nr:hypothetical protein ZIOFF_035052 [Zingiber officinale]